MRWKNEDTARRSEYGRRGGVAARGKAYRFTSEKAREAGRKGGLASAEARRCKGCGRVPARGETHECPPISSEAQP